MKVMTIYGTRPEFVRLCLILRKLDKVVDHVTVHTGQNYDDSLNAVFFRELDIRPPDEHLAASGTFAEQAATIFVGVEQAIRKHRPDRFLVLGDTNSSLGAVVAKRMGVPVFHLEAGNRCYDESVPEEVNRRIIDHCTDVHLPYTQRSAGHLIREGIPSSRVLVVGNPICEVMRRYRGSIRSSDIVTRLGLPRH
ncbi:unnamed protein product, partial [marine sediment metagenome]